MSFNGSVHAHPLDSPQSHASLLNVVGWFLTVATFLVVLTRLAIRRAVSHSIGLDDGFIIMALVCECLQTGNGALLSDFMRHSLSVK